MRILITSCFLLISALVPAIALAQWSHESELATVTVGGNTTSESYSGKQKTAYKVDTNTVTATGSYLQTKANGVETAKAWDAALRYEKAFSDYFSGYLQHGAESNNFAGYIQRDNSDIGGKYQIVKTDSNAWHVELGYRYSHTIQTNFNRLDESFGRAYTEYSFAIDKTFTGKFWVEYLPNFTNSDAYLVNAEPSISLILTDILSLKTAYLMKYHNRLVAAGEKYLDTSFTTALVAKF